MTKESLAQMLDGREYPFRLTAEETRLAELSNLVVIFGASDDLCEFEGAIIDEMGAPGQFLIADGKLLPELDDEDVDALSKHGALAAVNKQRRNATVVGAEWCPDGDGKSPSWRIRTAAPYAKFRIMEDGEVFCEAIVIDLMEAANVPER